MENKLISMLDFVLEQLVLLKNGEINILLFRNRIERYANFLKHELNIGMFVPAKKVNGVWVVLEEPKIENNHHGSFFKMQTDFHAEKEYHEAKENVLFEGFEIVYWNYDGSGKSYSIRKNNGKDNEIQVCYYKSKPNYFVWSFDNIEQLTLKDLTLTQSAKKTTRLMTPNQKQTEKLTAKFCVVIVVMALITLIFTL